MNDLLDLPIIWRHLVSMVVVLEDDSRPGVYTDIRDAILVQDAKKFCRALRIPWPAATAKLETFVHDENCSVN
jgi:hypothetical protein